RQLNDSVEQEHYLRIIADMTKTSPESVMKKFALNERDKPLRLKKVQTSTQAADVPEDQLVLEQHFLALLLTMTNLRYLLPLLPRELYSQRAQEFLESSKELEQVQESDDYGKMLSLLFEETYQHTD